MPENQKSKHFRVNPIELIIFSAFSVIFCNSMVSLLSDHSSTGEGLIAITPSESNPAGDKTLAARSGSTESPMFFNLDLGCESNGEQSTLASKLRLTGPLCAPTSSGGRMPASAQESTQVSQVQISNLTNHFTATVFTDSASRKYSTDYIPLESGKNQIQIETAYTSGKRMTQTFSVEKK